MLIAIVGIYFTKLLIVYVTVHKTFIYQMKIKAFWLQLKSFFQNVTIIISILLQFPVKITNGYYKISYSCFSIRISNSHTRDFKKK